MRTSKTFRILLTILVLLIFVVYFSLNINKFKLLLDVNVFLLVLIAFVNVTGILISGLFTKLILVPFHKYISMRESFYVSLISSVGNFFAPAGAGLGFRAIYLKKKHGLSYSKYVSILSGNYILVFLADSFVALVALYLLRSHYDSRYAVLAVTFGVIFLVSLFLSLVKMPTNYSSNIKNRYLHSIVKTFHSIMTGWGYIVSHKKLMIQLVCLTVLGIALNTVITFFIISALRLSISIAPLLLLSSLSTLSLFVNVTPANLGVKEAIYLFSSSVIGFSTPQILSIALVDRGVLFVVLFALWLFFAKLKHAEYNKALES